MGNMWGYNQYYEMVFKNVLRLIFLLEIDTFCLILWRWKSMVLLAKFISSAISFVVLPCLMRLITWVSVGDNLKNFEYK